MDFDENKEELSNLLFDLLTNLLYDLANNYPLQVQKEDENKFKYELKENENLEYKTENESELESSSELEDKNESYSNNKESLDKTFDIIIDKMFKNDQKTSYIEFDHNVRNPHICGLHNLYFLPSEDCNFTIS